MMILLMAVDPSLLPGAAEVPYEVQLSLY